jgi:hypothetical protein
LAATADDLREGRHQGLVRYAKAAAEIVPEGNPQFCAGLGEAEEGIATVASDIAARASADLSSGDLAANIPLGIVRMQRDVGAIEHGQQFVLVGMQPRQQAIQRDEAGAAAEDAVEAGAKLSAAAGCGVETVRFQIGIEPPDQRADTLLRDALIVVESIEFVYQSLGVNLILLSR